MSKSRQFQPRLAETGRHAAPSLLFRRAPGLPMEEAQRGWPEGRPPSGEEPYMRHFSVRQWLFRFFPTGSVGAERRSETAEHLCPAPHAGVLYDWEIPIRKTLISTFFKELSSLNRSSVPNRGLPMARGFAPSNRGICLTELLLSRIRFAAWALRCREGAYGGGVPARQAPLSQLFG